jgi:hypothetical protein
MGIWLRPYFPKMPSYSQFLKLYHVLGKVVDKNFLNSIEKHGEFIIDSTDIAVCKNIRQPRSRLFKNFAGWIITSAKTTYGFKLHLVINSWKQVVNFAITKGSISDISMARPLLQSLSGTGLGDRGYVSKDVRKALKNSGLNFIARARKNMKEKNTSEEIAHLSRRHMVETFLGKLKNRIRESFSHFRSWQGAKAAIVIVMAIINLRLQPVNALRKHA